MSEVITSLTTTFSPSALWGIIGDVIPFLGITTLFALGFYLVKRIINRTKKAKGGI